MEEKKKKQQAVNGYDAIPSPSSSSSSSPWQAFLVHLLSGLGLASALGAAHKFYSANLVSDPLHTLRLIWVIQAPIVVLIYSMFRSNPKQCSYWKAVGRGILGLPVDHFKTTTNKDDEDLTFVEKEEQIERGYNMTTTMTHQDMETDRQEESVIPPPTVQQPSMRCESSANSSQLIYTPEVKNEFIPKINQEFDSLKKVEEFYNRYAKEGGFGTRSHSSRKSTAAGNLNVIVRKEFCCFKQGLPVQKRTQSNKRRRGITRENCLARLAVVRKGEKYVVSLFFEGHNHSLTSPKRTHLLRSHRKVSTAKKALVEQLSAANVPTCQQMTILELESGGLENDEDEDEDDDDDDGIDYADDLQNARSSQIARIC